MHQFGAIIIGFVAGRIAGKLMRGRGYGIIADTALSLIGAIIGNGIFTDSGLRPAGGSDFWQWLQ